MSGLQIYSSTTLKSNSESPTEGSKRVSGKVDFYIVQIQKLDPGCQKLW